MTAWQLTKASLDLHPYIPQRTRKAQLPLSSCRYIHSFSALNYSNDSQLSIIAISGLAGHAYGSWARSPEKMWLRDYLPRDAPNARILTYGYEATLQGTSTSTIQDHAGGFVANFSTMRELGEVQVSHIF